MKTIDEIYIEYQNIVQDLEDFVAGGSFRRTREFEKPRIILQKALPGRDAAKTEEAGGDSLEAIAAEVRGCRLCGLCEKRTQAVPGVGVLRPLVLVIGEGPGEEEDLKGETFVGPAGRYLDKWLEAAGFSRNTNAYIAIS